MTDAERTLWAALRTAKLEFRFQRQRVIGPYICDFASIEAGLVIELDGSQHLTEEGLVKDRVRDEYLQGLGFRVLRFSDLDVMKNVEGVMAVIITEAQARAVGDEQRQPPLPPLQ
jgi:very-short-patch-repair endonuclease